MTNLGKLGVGIVTGLSGKNDPDIFAEWTAKRSWRDRKKAAKAGNIADLDQIKSTSPELIFYGRYSGVVGLCKNELFRAVDEPSFSGYDRVCFPNVFQRNFFNFCGLLGTFWYF